MSTYWEGDIVFRVLRQLYKYKSTSKEVSEGLGIYRTTMEGHLRRRGTSFMELRTKVKTRMMYQLLNEGASLELIAWELDCNSEAAANMFIKKKTGKTYTKNMESRERKSPFSNVIPIVGKDFAQMWEGL